MISPNGEIDSIQQVINDDCLKVLSKLTSKTDLVFLDPPFNQQKEYTSHNDDLPENEYWEMNCSSNLKNISAPDYGARQIDYDSATKGWKWNKTDAMTQLFDQIGMLQKAK